MSMATNGVSRRHAICVIAGTVSVRREGGAAHQALRDDSPGAEERRSDGGAEGDAAAVREESDAAAVRRDG
jgi:hypothetical protein